jgi:hypothetical protein
MASFEIFNLKSLAGTILGEFSGCGQNPTANLASWRLGFAGDLALWVFAEHPVS